MDSSGLFLMNNLIIIIRHVHSDTLALMVHLSFPDIGCTSQPLAPGPIQMVHIQLRFPFRWSSSFANPNELGTTLTLGRGEDQSKAYPTITKPQTYRPFLSITHHTHVGNIRTYHGPAPAVSVRNTHVINERERGDKLPSRGPADLLARFNATQPLQSLHICPRSAFDDSYSSFLLS